ncbi:MAG: PLP-dependent transferase, partial [Eubacteriales bacterium]|nr:PLP-dependent transferase [Eubacteriales bacterium]
NYPGLKSHPQYELMKSQQRGNCGLLSFEIDGTVEQAKKLAQSLHIFHIGVSWGGFESLVEMPYARKNEEEAKSLGGTPKIIRIHCGLEGAENQISDLKNALLQI